MITAASNTAFQYEDKRIPDNATTLPYLNPFPKIEEIDEDIHVFRVLDRSCYPPIPSTLPEKRHPVLDVGRMDVSASLLRRIEYELKHDACDLRTVYSSCRGLPRGSLEFENAYIKARIRSFTKHQRVATDPLLDMQLNARDSALNSRRSTMNHDIPALQHPMAVNHLGHLMSHLGIWVMALLGLQVWSSWYIGIFANTYLEGGRVFYFMIVLLLFLMIDSAVWFRRRGHLCDAFLAPGAVLFLIALLPIITLHLRGILLSAR